MTGRSLRRGVARGACIGVALMLSSSAARADGDRQDGPSSASEDAGVERAEADDDDAGVASPPAEATGSDAHDAGSSEAEPKSNGGTGAAHVGPATGDERGESIVVWPTLAPNEDNFGHGLHRPAPTEGSLYRRARDLDATLQDAVQDLGFTLDVADVEPRPRRVGELDMVERAGRKASHGGPDDHGTWVVSARLEPLGGDDFVLRLVAVAPRSKQLRVRIERVSGPDVSVRGLVMLRDLLTSARATADLGPKPEESASAGIVAPLRSQGRAVLAVNAALFGAFTAYSVQRASGSDDPRLMYPLLTLGSGIGIGGALLVAEEWDVRTGDAWTLAGGAWWGAAAGILIANGRQVQPLTDRYAWGVGGGLIGLAFNTYVLTRGHADEGDAMLVHSGAVLGLSLGALGDYYASGDLRSTNPATGAGYGAAIGMLGGTTLGALVTVSPSRVLLVDLGAGVGAGAGAALASPLIFENLTEAKTRGFIAATAAGTLIGGGIAWWLTRDAGRAEPPSKDRRAPQALRIVPTGGVIGSSATREGNAPAYGIGAVGTF